MPAQRRDAASSRLPEWLHVTCYALVLIAALGEILTAPVSPLRIAALVACLAAAAVGVALRRRAPWLLPAAGVVAACIGQSTLLALGCFAYVLRRRDRSAVVVALAGALSLASPWSADPTLVVIEAGRTTPGSLPGLVDWLVRLVGVVLVPMLLGAYVAARRSLLDEYRERAERAERERELRTSRAVLAERDRIAREMHDVLGHHLALASMQAGALEVGAGDETREAARALRSTVRAAVADLREVVRALDDPTSPTGAVAAAAGAPSIAGLVAAGRGSGADIAFADATDGALDARPPSPAVDRAAVRVVQEALSNAYRHAPGHRIDIVVAGTPGARLSVMIATPAPARAPDGTGTGLAGLAERVRLAGGELTAGPAPAPEHGFQVRAELPWPLADADSPTDGADGDANGRAR